MSTKAEAQHDVEISARCWGDNLTMSMQCTNIATVIMLDDDDTSWWAVCRSCHRIAHGEDCKCVLEYEQNTMRRIHYHLVMNVSEEVTEEVLDQVSKDAETLQFTTPWAYRDAISRLGIDIVEEWTELYTLNWDGHELPVVSSSSNTSRTWMWVAIIQAFALVALFAWYFLTR